MRWVFMEGNSGELRWMWLPMFLSQNTTLMARLQKELTTRYVREQATPRMLDEMDAFVTTWLQAQFPDLRGLKQYLDALRFVEE